MNKQLDVQDFLRQFNVSNQKQTRIKQLILKSLEELVDKKIIKPFFKITQKDGALIQKNKLTSRLIPKSRLISLAEILHYNNSIHKLEG